MSQDDLLAPVANRKLVEIWSPFGVLPGSFRSLGDRIEATLALWRFDEGGSGLYDWAVMQTGLMIRPASTATSSRNTTSDGRTARAAPQAAAAGGGVLDHQSRAAPGQGPGRAISTLRRVHR